MDDAMEGQVALGMSNITAILSSLLSRLLRSFPSLLVSCAVAMNFRQEAKTNKNSQSHEKNMNRKGRCRLDVDFKESGGQSLHSWIMMKNEVAWKYTFQITFLILMQKLCRRECSPMQTTVTGSATFWSSFLKNEVEVEVVDIHVYLTA